MIAEIEKHEEYGKFQKTGVNGHLDSHTDYYVSEKTVVKCRVTPGLYKVYEMNPQTGTKSVEYVGNEVGAKGYLLSRFGIAE